MITILQISKMKPENWLLDITTQRLNSNENNNGGRLEKERETRGC